MITPAVAFARIRHRGETNLQPAMDEIDDPIIGDLRTGIEAGFAITVVSQSGFADFDDQNSCGRVACCSVVARLAGNDGYIWLRR